MAYPILVETDEELRHLQQHESALDPMQQMLSETRQDNIPPITKNLKLGIFYLSN